MSGLLIYGDVRDGGHAIGELWSSRGRSAWGDLLWSGAELGERHDPPARAGLVCVVVGAAMTVADQAGVDDSGQPTT